MRGKNGFCLLPQAVSLMKLLLSLSHVHTHAHIRLLFFTLFIFFCDMFLFFLFFLSVFFFLCLFLARVCFLCQVIVMLSDYVYTDTHPHTLIKHTALIPPLTVLKALPS